MSKIKDKFLKLLVKKGVLNPLTRTVLVRGISGENAALLEWCACARPFIHKGARVSVGMRVERLMYNESRCTPIVRVKV